MSAVRQTGGAVTTFRRGASPRRATVNGDGGNDEWKLASGCDGRIVESTGLGERASRVSWCCSILYIDENCVTLLRVFASPRVRLSASHHHFYTEYEHVCIYRRATRQCLLPAPFKTVVGTFCDMLVSSLIRVRSSRVT